MLPEFKIYQPIQFGIFLTFATIKIAGETKYQNLISARIKSLESLYLHSGPSLIEDTIIFLRDLLTFRVQGNFKSWPF